MGQGRRKATAPAAGRKATRRIVLEKVKVIVLTGESAQGRTALDDLLPGVDAWLERGEFDGDRPKDAIEQHVKPGTPEQLTGEFRAVPLSNWKGGRRYKLPEQVPLIGESID